MADGGILLFGFCALATLAVLPTAILASTMFGAPPQPQYLAAWRRRTGWGGGTVVMPAPGVGSHAWVRLPVPQDGSEYLVVRADTFSSGDNGSVPPPARAEEREAEAPAPEAAAEVAGGKCE